MFTKSKSGLLMPSRRSLLAAPALLLLASRAEAQTQTSLMGCCAMGPAAASGGGGAVNPPTFVSVRGGNTPSGASPLTLPAGGASGDLLILQNENGFTTGETVVRHSDSVSLHGLAYDIGSGSGGNQSLWDSILIAAETSLDTTGMDGTGAGVFSASIFRPGAGQTFAHPAIHVTGGIPDFVNGTSPLTLTGFTPGPKTCGAVAIIVDRAQSATITQHTGTTGFTQAGAAVLMASNLDATVYYNFAYAGGNPAFDFSTPGGAGYFKYGYLVELLYV